MHDQLHVLTRERLLDEAVRDGKFTPERRAHYAAMYDRDPLAAAATIGALASAPTIPAQVAPHVHPVTPVQTSDATPEQIEQWTNQLFPETRPARELEATVQARGPSAYPLVMTDGKD